MVNYFVGSLLCANDGTLLCSTIKVRKMMVAISSIYEEYTTDLNV